MFITVPLFYKTAATARKNNWLHAWCLVRDVISQVILVN